MPPGLQAALPGERLTFQEVILETHLGLSKDKLPFSKANSTLTKGTQSVHSNLLEVCKFLGEEPMAGAPSLRSHQSLSGLPTGPWQQGTWITEQSEAHLTAAPVPPLSGFPGASEEWALPHTVMGFKKSPSAMFIVLRFFL